MLGTIVEMHSADARELDITNGDVVSISGNEGRSFKGVATVQEPIPGGATEVLPRGMVFAYFSYPVNKKSAAAADGPSAGRVFAEAGQVRHDGYVNNITSTYVDAINPIAAVKFARGKITKTGQRYPGLDQPHHEQHPSTALRHVAFARIPPVAASADG